jgi:hypothetical protein
MDRRFKWVLPVDVWTGRVQVAGLPRTRDAIMAVAAPQWVAFGAALHLDIRPADTLDTMRNQYALWIGIGYNFWR